MWIQIVKPGTKSYIGILSHAIACVTGELPFHYRMENDLGMTTPSTTTIEENLSIRKHSVRPNDNVSCCCRVWSGLVSSILNSCIRYTTTNAIHHTRWQVMQDVHLLFDSIIRCTDWKQIEKSALASRHYSPIPSSSTIYIYIQHT